MALWDSADLLSRMVSYMLRPESETSDASNVALYYALLTEAQSEWVTHIASVAPSSQVGAPCLMVSTDGGQTYEFRNAQNVKVFPMGHAEIRASRGGPLLLPTSDASMAGDYVPEGDHIRIPNGVTRVYPAGPYARFIDPAGEISASSAPTLNPPHARILLVFRALSKWARRGGMRDPQPFLDMENEAWFGNPAAGVHGILGMLQTQQAVGGIPMSSMGGSWWRGNADLGRTWGA